MLDIVYEIKNNPTTRYLEDGIYAVCDHNRLVLCTFNGEDVRDVIYFELKGIKALDKYIKMFVTLPKN